MMVVSLRLYYIRHELTVDEVVLVGKQCGLSRFATTSWTNENNTRSVRCRRAGRLADECHYCKQTLHYIT